MSEDNITQLRETYPYLNQFTDDQLIEEGFLSIPDNLMEDFAKIKSDAMNMPEVDEARRQQILKAQSTLEPLYDKTPSPFQAPEREDEGVPVTGLEFNLNDYVPPSTFGLGYDELTSNARDIFERAERGDLEGITPEDIEAATKIIYNNRPGIDRSERLLSAEEAREKNENSLGILGFLEPFDYPRGLSWAALSYLGDYLPEKDDWAGQQLEDLAGFVGSSATTGAQYASPYFQTLNLFSDLTDADFEDVGFGETLGRNLYRAASSGELAKAVTRFHGDGIPLVDTGYRLPNLTGPAIMDVVLPKEEMAVFRDRALAAGAEEQAEVFDQLATSDIARTVAGIMPEFIADPLWFTGPAKAGQVVQKGGQALLVGGDLVRAARAVATRSGKSADELINLAIDGVEGSEKVLTDFSRVADSLSDTAKAGRSTADAYVTASKASPTESLRAATAALTQEVEKLTAKAEDAATILKSEGKLDEVAKLEERTAAQVSQITNLASTLATDKNFAINSQRFLLSQAKKLRAQAGVLDSRATDINKFVKLVEAGGSGAQRQVMKSRGFNFHVPFTNNQFSVGIPFQSGYKITPRPGDTAATISNNVGVSPVDLARLNGLTGADQLDKLDDLIAAGKPIVYQIGYTSPAVKRQIAASSFLPEGVVYNYLRGAVPAPIVSYLGDAKRYFSASNAERINALESAGQPITRLDEFGRWYANKIGKRTTTAVDRFNYLFANRFVQPLMANQQLSRAVRYLQERNLNVLDQQKSPSDAAVVRLKELAPDLWNAYTSAVSKYLRKTAAENDGINNFMNRLQRKANEIALSRVGKLKPDGVTRFTKKDTETTGDYVMQQIFNEIESGAGVQLSKAERELRNEVLQKLREVGDNAPLEREEVRQSLINMVRFVQGNPASVADQIEEVRRLELLLEDFYKFGVKLTDDKITRLQAKIKQIRKFKTKNKAPKKRAIQRYKDAIQQLRNVKRVLSTRTIGKDGKIVKSPNPTTEKFIRDMEQKIESLTSEIAKREEVLEGRRGEVLLTAPPFKIKKGKKTSAYTRPLLRWEINLFKQYEDIVTGINKRRVDDGLQELSSEEQLRAVMAIFQESPNSLNNPEAFKRISERYVGSSRVVSRQPLALNRTQQEQFATIQKQIDEIIITSPDRRTANDKALLQDLYFQQDNLYRSQWRENGGFVPQAFSERFGGTTEDIQELKQTLQQMFEKYETLYKQYGRDFTRDPFERMKLWGVVGYVPHMRKDFRNPIDDKTFSALYSRGELDRQLSLNLDQANRRNIAGLISEINALPIGNKLENWSFSADPNLLTANFMSGSKSLTNQDFLVALMKGGVIRTFNTLDEAAQLQYVPLFNYGEYTRDLQILLMGNSGEIAKLISGKTGEPANYADEFSRLLTAAQKNGTRIGSTLTKEQRPLRSWADDVAEIRETDTVEQALAGINLHAHLRGEETFNAITRHDELVDQALQTRRAQLQALLAKKREVLQNASARKDLKTLRNDIVRIQKRLIEEGPVYEKAKQKAIRDSWKQVTEEINSRVASANNEKFEDFKIIFHDGVLPNISTKALSTYMAKDQEMFRLYIPATVQEAMSRQFGETLLFGSREAERSGAKRFVDRINNMWKTRITVTSLAFTARNFIGNTFSNALNMGTGGALNLDTNYKASLIGALVDYHAKYGSIDNAIAELGADTLGKKRPLFSEKGVDSKLIRAREKADLASLRTRLNGLGVQRGSDLVDLGDGIKIPLDDALADLQQRGVISGSSAYRVDVDEMTYELQRMQAQMGVKERTGKVIKPNKFAMYGKQIASGTEDLVYMTLPFIMGAPFVAVPKFIGRTISRRTENQARMVNYIGNLKQGKTPDEAADLVNKFLFDYNDLTRVQKVWLRSLIPFFTWNQKNMLLHAELMETNPTYYAQMYRFFYVGMPELMASIEREDQEELGLDIPQVDPRDRAAIRARKGPHYNGYRIGVEIDPTNSVFIQGFGLPIEGFAQYSGSANDIMEGTFESVAHLSKFEAPNIDKISDSSATYLAQTHVGIQMISDLVLNYDLFRGQSMTDRGSDDFKLQYTLANDYGNLVQRLTSLSNPSIPPDQIEGNPGDTPAGRGHQLAQFIIDSLDMVAYVDPKEGKYYWVVQNPNKTRGLLAGLRLLPQERLLREAATAIDLNETMYLTPERMEGGKQVSYTSNENAVFLRWLSAYTGLKFKQDTTLTDLNLRFEDDVTRELTNYHRLYIDK
mgnify:CR=1 FL=1